MVITRYIFVMKSLTNIPLMYPAYLFQKPAAEPILCVVALYITHAAMYTIHGTNDTA